MQFYKIAKKPIKLYQAFALAPEWDGRVEPLPHAFTQAASPRQAELFIMRRQDRGTREVESYLSLESAGWRVVYREVEPKKPKEKEEPKEVPVEPPKETEQTPVNNEDDEWWF